MRTIPHGAPLCAILGLLLVFHTPRTKAATFDFDNGNVLFEVFGPVVAPAILSEYPQASDASLVLRITTITANAWFDAIAPYHPTAIGVYSRLGRRPPEESATNRNKNIALLYASYRAMNSLLPQHAADWRNMLTSVGLDPDDAHTGKTDPIGIGNAAGFAVVAARERDGMNQLGDEGGRRFNRQPYSDYTGYQPVNTAYGLEREGSPRCRAPVQRNSLSLWRSQGHGVGRAGQGDRAATRLRMAQLSEHGRSPGISIRVRLFLCCAFASKSSAPRLGHLRIFSDGSERLVGN